MSNKNSSTNSLDFFIADSPGNSEYQNISEQSENKVNPNIPKTQKITEDKEQTACRVSEILSNELEENLIDCTVSLQTNNPKNLEFSQEKISLSFQEYEQLKNLFKLSSQRRINQKAKKQELRSSAILEKIKAKESNTQSLFFKENRIIFSEEKQKWCYISRTNFNEDLSEYEHSQKETLETINFFFPEYSWLLEIWLAKQTDSFSIKRFNGQEHSSNKPVYQISFGLSNQNFIEVEAPNKESCLIAVAEDLLSQDKG